MFGHQKRRSAVCITSRTVWCPIPIELDNSLRDKAIMAIVALESVYKVEAAIRGGYYGLWVDFYRFRALASKSTDLVQIEEIIAGLERDFRARRAT